jgi:hypothetical protein
MMHKDLTTMRRRLGDYILTKEMQRLSPMDIEVGWNMWNWLRL